MQAVPLPRRQIANRLRQRRSALSADERALGIGGSLGQVDIRIQLIERRFALMNPQREVERHLVQPCARIFDRFSLGHLQIQLEKRILCQLLGPLGGHAKIEQVGIDVVALRLIDLLHLFMDSHSRKLSAVSVPSLVPPYR